MSENEDFFYLDKCNIDLPIKTKAIPISTIEPTNVLTDLQKRVESLELKLNEILHLLSGRQFIQRSMSFESENNE